MESPSSEDDDDAQPVPSIPATDAQEEEGQGEEEEHIESGSESDKEIEQEDDASYHQEEDRGPFEEYFINTENVAEKRRLPYIMMMFKALGFNLEEIYPYSEILKDSSAGGGGWIRALKATKEMIAQELLRQNPTARLNRKNVTLEDLQLRLPPLTDPRDVAFVMKEERKIRRKFYEVVRGDWSQDPIINSHVVYTPPTTVVRHPSHTYNKLENEKSQRLKARVRLDNKKQKTGQQLFIPPRQHEGGGTYQTTAPAPDISNTLLFPTSHNMSLAAAEKTMHAAISFADLRDWKITVAIVDAGGTPVLVKRLDGAPSASYDIALGRAKNAAHFLKSTGEIEQEAHGLDRVLKDTEASPFISKRGGCPMIVANGRCIGAIGVSGAPTATNDEQVAKQGVAFILSLFGSQII